MTSSTVASRRTFKFMDAGWPLAAPDEADGPRACGKNTFTLIEDASSLLEMAPYSSHNGFAEFADAFSIAVSSDDWAGGPEAAIGATVRRAKKFDASNDGALPTSCPLMV